MARKPDPEKCRAARVPGPFGFGSAVPVRAAWPALFLLALAASALPSAAVTLVSRSAGLELPLKEEGKTELEVGDVNGDGRLDLVSVGDHGNPNFNSDEHGLMVWLGDGAGGWTVSQTGSFGYGGCALGDLDRDGHLDVAWGLHHNYGSGMGSRLISAARGDGTGSNWTDWGQGLATNGEDWGMFATALADFDGDGRLDLVSESFGGTNGLQLYRNRGDGTWNPAWALTGGTVQYTIEACDLNGDGYADIASTRSGSTVLLGDGTFGFATAMAGLPSGTIRCVDAGDMNGDGRDEIVFGLASAGLRCCRYDPGTESWQDASSGLPVSGAFTMAQLGDINGDGNLDVAGYAAPAGSIYLGDGLGHWTADATWTMPSPGDYSALRVDGDFDHDGREDIFVQATQSGFPFYRNQLRAYSAWQPPSALAARVVAPRGGEVLRLGSIRDIRWVTAVPQVLGQASIAIRLSVSGPGGPWTPLAAGLPDNGRYEWQVDAPGPSTQCRLEITATAGGETVAAMSAADFAILAPEGTDVPERPHARGTRLDALVLCPNPAVAGTAVLRIPEQDDRRNESVSFSPGDRVLLIDPTGRTLRSWQGIPACGLTLDLTARAGSTLPSGVYLVRIEVEGRARALRLVKR